MHSPHPSEDLYSFKQWKNIKEVQRSTEIHGSTCACCQPELIRMSSMKAQAGPTPLPQEMQLSWDNTHEVDPSADKPPLWFLQLRKPYSSFKGSIWDFLYCLKLHFFQYSSVTAQNHSCHTMRGL